MYRLRRADSSAWLARALHGSNDKCAQVHAFCPRADQDCCVQFASRVTAQQGPHSSVATYGLTLLWHVCSFRQTAFIILRQGCHRLLVCIQLCREGLNLPQAALV